MATKNIDLIIDRMQKMDTLVMLLPYEFPDKEAILNGLTLCCSGCHEIVPNENVRAEMISYNKGSVSLEAYVACMDCKLITPVAAKFSSDGSALYKNGDEGWIAGRWGKEPPTMALFFGKIRAMLGL